MGERKEFIATDTNKETNVTNGALFKGLEEVLSWE